MNRVSECAIIAPKAANLLPMHHTRRRFVFRRWCRLSCGVRLGASLQLLLLGHIGVVYV